MPRNPEDDSVLRRWLHRLMRLLPRRFHTRRMRLHERLDGLEPAQREQLRRNLRRLVHPKAA